MPVLGTTPRALLAFLAAALLTLVVAAGPARAQATGATGATASTVTKTVPAADPNTPVNVTDLDTPPAGYTRKGREILAIAARQPDAKRIVNQVKGAYAGAYTKGPGRWQVSYFSRDKPPKEVAQMYIDDASGRVTEHYTSYKVPWTMARGYSGAFGRKVNSPWVWIPMTVLFLVPFALTRGVRIDLVAIAAFGISVAFFNDAEIWNSVPISWSLMVFLLGRMLWLGLRRVPDRPPMRLWIPPAALAVGVVFLLGFRVGLDLTNSNVIDVGYGSVVGADRIASGEPVYANFPKDIEHGDTYGPVMYAAYVPFSKLLGFSGRWDGDLPAAHGAAIAWDLLACLLLFLLGRRMRGPTLGIVLAYAWASCPLTLYALMSNTNDSLVAVFLIAALLAAARPAARGALVALGGMTKFATLGLGPLFALHAFDRTRSWGVVRYTLAFAVAFAVAMLPLWLHGQGIPTLYDRTLGFQNDRGAPFSPWGLYDEHGLQRIWQLGSVVLAVGLAFVPRRRDVAGLAACSAAIVLALEASLTYWFYLYIVWFAAPVFVASFGRFGEERAVQADVDDDPDGETEVPPAPVDEPELEAVPSHATSSGSIAVARSR